MANAPAAPVVLLADDDPDDLFFAQRLLKQSGLQAPIVTCGDGSEIIALLKTWAQEQKAPPLAIFLDVKMPKQDGFQTLKWIREQSQFAGVRVVMLSGSAERRDVELAHLLGATDYLVKYPPAAEFARVLRRAPSTPADLGAAAQRAS